MIRLLIIKPGRTAPEVLREHGDYDRWFTDALQGEPIAWDLCDATTSPIPPLSGYSGVIVTGSTASTYRAEGWMEPLARFLRGSDRCGLPVLCVCFGCQMLAQARGGEVVLNPEGWEIGGIRMSLTEEAASDPLFAGLPSPLGGLSTHEDRIQRLPPGAVLLAGNRNSPVQAFRIGEMVWGAQFHPEITPAILEILIRLRADSLTRDASAHGQPAEGHVERLLATLRDPDALQGAQVLARFIEVCRTMELRGQAGPRRLAGAP